MKLYVNPAGTPCRYTLLIHIYINITIEAFEYIITRSIKINNLFKHTITVLLEECPMECRPILFDYL